MPDIDIPVDIVLYAHVIASNPQTTSSDWSLPCYKDLKDYIKEYYSIIQEDICCYCKINLRHGGYGEPIEHIVPKDDRPQWMFEPKNLALSCYPCNTKKNADNTLSKSGKVSVTYPSTTNAFSIYHPHFDVWDQHFEVFRKYFLKPTSKKGKETFDVCELYRINLPLDRAKLKGIKEENFRIRVISLVLIDPTLSTKIIKQCTDISREIIYRAKVRKGVLGP